MLIRKRNGEDVTFDKSKIARALEKANNAVSVDERLSIAEIVNIADAIEKYYIDNNTLASVESVQDMVITKIMECGKFKLAKEYITYRYQHELLRKGNSTDEEVFHIVNGTSEEIREENSNKNTDILPTQRDYIAGIVSKDITDRYLLPSDILQAHNDGLIHFHDKDYFVTKEHNCGLVNLDDMLQNGTVISETKIDRPHRFSTACNIATQIIAQVASSQYGGQSITLTHIAKFVDVSRQAIRKEVIIELDKAGVAMYSDEQIEKIVEIRLRKEVNAGIQTIQYQVLTLMTTNGQTPFITVFLNLSEAEGDKILEKDLAMCIEEVLLQRIQGIKNEVGVYVTPAFPKLIYVLDENNVYKGSPYRYLTELAAKCTAKQMVPDYISAKMMRQLKGGDVYTCMGCTDKDAVISYILNGIKYTESISRAWDRCAELFKINTQPNDIDKYIDCSNMAIWDSEKNSYVDCYRIIRNHSDEWLELTFSNGRILNCTPDHPFETINRGIVYAKDLTEDDKIKCDISCSNIDGNITFNEHKAWLLGFTLCDGCYDHHVTTSIAYNSENDIRDAFITRMKEEYEYDVRVIEQHRGPKGNYLDLMVIGNKYRLQRQMAAYLISKFEGFQKIYRHIPNEVFTWDHNARLSFLAGMIDADGYINNNSEEVQIGSTNKELAMQQLLLAQSLGMPAYVYRNHYNSNYKCKVRYAVSFYPTKELIDRIVSKKKTDMIPTERIGAKQKNSNAVISLRKRNMVFIPNEYSYDVTTASEHFTVDGIYSHNCRSFLTPDRFTDTLHENIANALNWDPTKHKYYGRLTTKVKSTINRVNALSMRCA